MQGVSRESYAAARERLYTLVQQPDVDPSALGDQLFAVERVLSDEPAVRRALADPAGGGEARTGLLQTLFGSRVDETTRDVLAGAVRARWSRPRDLVDAVDALGVQSHLAAAERAGHLDDVEDELFRFGRIVAAEPQLRAALADRTVDGERKRVLVGQLLERSDPTTRRLVEHLVTAPSGASLEQGLADYGAEAAQRRERIVALVRAAVPLTEQQRDRLARLLAGVYGHEIHLNVVIDEDVLGGISVRGGDEIIDGTVAARLEEARRRLTG
jgi:F-type H+-transporting ATPase subunit delta